MKTKMADFYLSYLNEFLTIEHFAEYHDMSINQTQTILTIGRMFHEERCAPGICPVHCRIGSSEKPRSKQNERHQVRAKAVAKGD